MPCDIPRIAILLPSMRGGGAERVMLNIGRALTTKGYRIDLVLLEAKGPFLKDLPAEINLVDLGVRRALFALPALRRYLTSAQPLVLISSLPHINIIGILGTLITRKRTKIIAVEHNTLSQLIVHSPNFGDRLLPIAMSLTYRFADHLVAVSEGVSADLQRLLRLPETSISVIYNPVITPEIEAKSNLEVSHPWLKVRDVPVVVAIGRLTKAKCFSLLLTAFQRSRLKEDAKLLILGDGPDRSTLETSIDRLGLREHVQLLGFVANPYRYIKNSDLFVLSSLWEGLPTVLIEALYLGTPIVSTDCPSGPREILQEGKFGTLVPVNDIDSLSEAIVTSLRRRHSAPSRAGWIRFTEDFALSRYQYLLNEMIKTK